MERAFLAGLAGGSGGGKTFFCENLERALGTMQVKSFHMDEYFKPKEERPYTEAFITGKKYVDDNHPLTVDLDRLKHDLRDSLEKWEVILIEGLLTLWDPELYEMLDLKLFVDCRADERIVRRLRRNMRRGLGFDEIADVYLDMVRYRHEEYVEPSKWRADIILNGSNPSETSLRLVAEFIQNHRNERIIRKNLP
jgi:uridine kinase